MQDCIKTYDRKLLDVSQFQAGPFFKQPNSGAKGNKVSCALTGLCLKLAEMLYSISSSSASCFSCFKTTPIIIHYR